MDHLTWQVVSGQALSLVALALCIAAFSSKQDDRLLLILVLANVAFALHFVLLGGWTAAALTALIVVRIVLARRFKGSSTATILLLAASAGAAAFTWQGPFDALPLMATVLGTVGMFLLHGIGMRVALAGAALAWALNNIALGSIGGAIAEIIILTANVITIGRIARDRYYARSAEVLRDVS